MTATAQHKYLYYPKVPSPLSKVLPCTACLYCLYCLTKVFSRHQCSDCSALHQTCITSKTFLKENPTKELVRNPAWYATQLFLRKSQQRDKSEWYAGSTANFGEVTSVYQMYFNSFLQLKSIKWQTIFLVEWDHFNWGSNAFLICSLFRKSTKNTLKGML